MLNVYGILIGLMFFLPLLVGVWSIFIGPNHRRKLMFSLLIVLIMSTSLGLFLGEADIETPFSFMGEMITFSISYTALVIYLVSMLILLGMAKFNSEENGQFLTGFHSFLLSTSLSFGFIAFISGQFMIRYIALDIVGLIAALIVIKSLDDRDGGRRFSVIFSILRFGDLCLLVSILMLFHHAGTIDISEMIQTAVALPSGVQSWVFGGFFIAILVKTATWPFSLWTHHARLGTKDIRFWISNVLMPGLGYYLLYRIQPMIVSNGTFINGILFFSAGLLILMILIDVIDPKKYVPFMDIGGLFGLFIFSASVLGAKDHLKFFIVGVLIYRTLHFMKDNFYNPNIRKLLVFFPLMINVLYIGANFDNLSPLFILGWVISTVLFVFWRYWREVKNIREHPKFLARKESKVGNIYPGGFIEESAQWLNQNVEMGLFTDGVYRVSGAFKELAVWLNEKVETEILTSGFYRLSDGLVNSADWISEWVEQGIERLYSWISDNLMAISEGALFKFEVESAQKSEEFLESSLESLDNYEQNVLKKNLRFDLAWIPLLLILIIVLMLVV